MAEFIKPNRVGIEGVSYSLAHVPDLVRFGSKPLRELRGNPALAGELARLLRDFPAATAYAPHQVYIGNIGPAQNALTSHPDALPQPTSSAIALARLPPPRL